VAKKFLTLIIDCSGSMGGIAPTIDAAIKDMLREMQKDKANDYWIEVTQLGYGRPYELTMFSGTPTEILGRGRMPLVFGSGGTPLFDGIYETLNTVADPVGLGATATCVLISDGAGSEYRHTWKEAAEIIKDKVAIGWRFEYAAVDHSATYQCAELNKLTGKNVLVDLTRFANIEPYFQKLPARL